MYALRKNGNELYCMRMRMIAPTPRTEGLWGWRGFAASAHRTHRKTMTKGYEGIKVLECE